MFWVKLQEFLPQFGQKDQNIIRFVAGELSNTKANNGVE